MNKTERSPYYDFLRGIATLFVVAIHMFSHFYTSAEQVSYGAIFLYNLVSCAVPIFCASSAFFLINKNLDGGNYKRFILKQGIRVYIPMIFFSLPYFILSIINGGAIFKNVIKLFFGAYSVYYFPITILQFYLLLPLFQSFRGFRNIIIGFIVTFYYYSLWYFLVRPTINLPTVLLAGPLPFYFCYFVIGSRYGKEEQEVKKTAAILVAIVCVAVLGINTAYDFVSSKNSNQVVLGGPIIVLFFALIVFLLYSPFSSRYYKETFFTKIFEKLGVYSYGIYFSHLLVFEIIVKVKNKLAYTIVPPPHTHQNSAFTILDFGYNTNYRHLLFGTMVSKKNYAKD